MKAALERSRRSHLATTFSSSRIVVFDMDGTLYRQAALRTYMARMIAARLLWSRAGRRKISIIRQFRKARELLADQEATGVINKQYDLVSDYLGVSDSEVRKVTTEWLEERPLPVLARCIQPGAPELFRALRSAGIRIAVLSDYPAKAKLEAIGLAADIVVSAADPDVNCFKPLPVGLQRILDLSGEQASQCLLIGDRDERDGECARRARSNYLIKVSTTPRSALEVQHFGEIVSVLEAL